MEKIKKIKQVLKSIPTLEGAGVHLNRVFGYYQVPLFDPFLLLDDFRSDNPEHYLAGFPWHPHRGIETITYMLEGRVEHGDSIGNKGVIMPGEVQWMTAGSGIIHQEMPKGDDRGRMGGFQLWANLPAAHKMMGPRYREIKADRIPEVKPAPGVRVKIICGRIGNTEGPVRDIVTNPSYLDVTVEADTEARLPTVQGHNVFAYIIEGCAFFDEARDRYSYRTTGKNYFDFKDDAKLRRGTCLLFGPGESILVKTEAENVRFLLASGRPLGETVAWYGPIVMNTQEELRTAFREFQEGTFIKND
jgi:redox-sensitive bicupin YhaK (pirin superfamily)